MTVDNGISAAEEIDYAKSLGIDTVVTDHHLPGERLPRAEAIVDAHLPDSFCEFRDYAGVGVAYMLVCALNAAPCEDMLEKFRRSCGARYGGYGSAAFGKPRLLKEAGLSVLNRRKRPG